MVNKKHLSLFLILWRLISVSDASQQHSSEMESQKMKPNEIKGSRTTNDDETATLKSIFTRKQGLTKENVAEDNSPALAKIVSELKNEVNQLNGRVTRLEIMKPLAESFENRRSRRGSPDDTNSSKSKSTPKPCLVREACAYDYKINSNSTIITPNGGQPTSCSDLFQLGYTLNGFYLIKSDAANSPIDTLGLTQLEAIFCGFTKPEGPLNSPAIEKRIGFLKLDANKASSNSEVTQSPSIKQGNEVTNEPSQSNTESLTSDKLLFHLQINSNGIIQTPGNAIVFDNIILNADKSFDPKSLVFLAPDAGNYKFVFETKILEEKNVTFHYGATLPPDYRSGWTLKRGCFFRFEE